MAWKVDATQSKIEFSVRHFKVTTVRGHFGSFEGTVTIDEENPQASSVEGTVNVNTLSTGISPRDANLRSAAFFDAKRFPRMSFRSTRLGDMEGKSFKVYGEMTIRDVTREVVFDAVDKGDMPAIQGKRRRAFGASIVLNRKDFDLEWNPLIETAGIAVSDEVRGTMEIQVMED